ncbi:MAG: response regulator transcription factor [Bacteroidia bacterium]|nr:response regulator transcription factor [Bacteroidia bacterium]
MINVLIADDQPIYRDGLRFSLDGQEDIHIAGEVGNGQQVLDFLQKESPDILLLDINMPVMDGLETLKHLQENHSEVRVIMLTIYDESKLIMRLLEEGVDGYILKESDSREILEAIRTVSKGGTYYGFEVMKKVAGMLKGKFGARPKSNLTTREVEIVKLIVQEYSAKEIADKLFISGETVHTHRKNIREKLGVRNSAGIVREAIRQGWVLDWDF